MLLLQPGQKNNDNHPFPTLNFTFPHNYSSMLTTTLRLIFYKVQILKVSFLFYNILDNDKYDLT